METESPVLELWPNPGVGCTLDHTTLGQRGVERERFTPMDTGTYVQNWTRGLT